MRIVVYPSSLDIGGSQINAVELAAAVRDRGHDVVMFAAEPGPLGEMIARLGLQLVIAPPWKRRPSPAIARALVDLCRRRRIHIVHGYEWPPCLEAFYGPFLRDGVAVGCTVMSMAVAPFIPRSVPLIVGTAQIAAAARRRRFQRVDVLEPPVDTALNHPDVDGGAFRAAYGLGDRPTVVLVSRLALTLKLEGIEHAIAAARSLAGETGLRLVIVGDGPARGQLARAAAEVNAFTGEATVILTGELPDPRPAYAAADVALGMGGSALRAMAFAKPVVVLGERGFAEPLAPASAATFMWQGFYGLGDGHVGPDRLAGLLRPILLDRGRRQELGAFARHFVESRFSLASAAERQVDCYAAWMRHRPHGAGPLADAVHATSQLLIYKLRRRAERWRGRQNVEDFNAIPEIAKTIALAGPAQ